MTHPLRAIWWIGALAGCSTQTQTNGIAINDLANAQLTAQCSHDVACNDEPDEATCRASNGALTDSVTQTLIADVEAGTVMYDGVAAQHCIDELTTTMASCAFAGFHDVTPDCANLFEGTLATGAACFIGQECVSQHCSPSSTACDATTQCCPGTCAAPQPSPAAIGQPCGGSGSAGCVDAAYCSIATNLCTAPIAVEGAPCDSEIGSCANPMVCRLADASPTCRTPPAHGASCLPADAIPCLDERDHCDPTSLTCTTDAALGAACSDTIPCVGLASCVNLVCVPAPELGEACAEPTDFCLGRLTCDNGTCAGDPTGSACR